MAQKYPNSLATFIKQSRSFKNSPIMTLCSLLINMSWGLEGLILRSYQNYSFSNQHFDSCNKYMRKNVHPVYEAGIRTYNLLDMSLLPKPLDQGSGPTKIRYTRLPGNEQQCKWARAWFLPLQILNFLLLVPNRFLQHSSNRQKCTFLHEAVSSQFQDEKPIFYIT